MNKPLTVLLEEFKENIVQQVNISGLPFFVVEYALRDIVKEVHSASMNQYMNDKAQYEKWIQLQKQQQQQEVNAQ